MRYFGLSATIALLVALAPPVSAATPAWEPATANSVTAGAAESHFNVEASVTLPQSCYSARIRSTPISLHSTRTFYVEQMAPSSPCKATAAFTCTIVSPDFPLPIPQTITVNSKGPAGSKKWKVTVHTHETAPAPPMCNKG
ncbi:MAG TPA: hypothetical protein VMU38_06270 [Candidatus Binatia bacterium]|nr:hypothetical protein [Candidatus Binatia bacterium]